MALPSFIRKLLYSKQSTAYIWQLRHKYEQTGSSVLKWYYFRKYQKLMDRNNASIPFTAEFADMPTLPHGLSGIYISAGAKIGKACVIFHQVTIGSNMLPGSKSQGFPTLGDNVYIGAGAKIIGNVTIGNNVRIGANCVVTTDIPDNATVVLEKPRIIVKDAPQDNRFISQAQLQRQA